MSADHFAVLLVLCAAPAATAIPVLYAWTARHAWFRTVLGWALMTQSVGLALLIDISLAYQWLGDDYALRDVVRLTVYALIAVGTNLALVALAYEWWRGRKR
ncbi:putative phage holin [Nocardioides terrigena]|uniref:putative phage holin n=1 Tax=Nocardioides terrigena TaxID=424797 RepID=UPI000D2FC837|nr:hypothetical protein [Nocardioides terrigena]